MLPKITIHLEERDVYWPDAPEWQIEHARTREFIASLRFDGKTVEELESDVTEYTLEWAWNKCAFFVQLAQMALVQESRGFPIVVYLCREDIQGNLFTFWNKSKPEWRYIHVPIIPIPLIQTIRSWGHEPLFWTAILKDGFLEIPSESEEIPLEQMRRLFSDNIIEYWMSQQIEDFDVVIHYPSKNLAEIRNLLESTLLEAA